MSVTTTAAEPPEEPTPTGPSKDPTDLAMRYQRQQSTLLVRAAREARERPGAWVYAGSTQAPASELEWRFVKEVVDGTKATLGGTSEQWNAAIEEGVVRSGRPHLIDRKLLRPGESLVRLKYICYLGPRPDGA